MRRVAVLAVALVACGPTGAHAQGSDVQTVVTGVNLVGGDIQVVGGTSAPDGGFDFHPFVAYYDLDGELLDGHVLDPLSGTFQESYVDAQGVTHAVTTSPGAEPVYTRIATDGTVVSGLEEVDLGAGVTNLSQPFDIVPVGSSSVVFLNEGGQILTRWIGADGNQTGGQTFQFPPDVSTVGNSAFRDGSNIVVVGNADGDGIVLYLNAVEATTSLTPDNGFAGDGFAASTSLDDIGTGVRASYAPAADRFVFFGAATAGGVGQEAFDLSGGSLGAAVGVPGLFEARKALQLSSGSPLHVGGWASPADGDSRFRIGHSLHAGGGVQSGFAASTPFDKTTSPEDFSLTQDGRLAVGSTDVPQPGVPGGVVSLFNADGTPHLAFGGTGHVRIDPETFGSAPPPEPDVNEAPVNVLPSSPIVFEGQTLTMTDPIVITDPDAGANEVTVELDTDFTGTLTLSRTSGLDFIIGDGVDDGFIRVGGTLATINAALSGLRFTPTPQAVERGVATIRVFTFDRGHSGPLGIAGAEDDEDILEIIVARAQPSPGGGGQAPGGGGELGPPPGGAADLLATAKVSRSTEFFLSDGGRLPLTVLPIAFEVRNFGPDSAAGVSATPGGSRVGLIATAGSSCSSGPLGLSRGQTSVLCDSMAVGSSFDFLGAYEVGRPGRYVATLAAGALAPPDPGPRPNQASVEVEVERRPDTKGLRFTTRSGLVPAGARGPTISGKATGARTVYVAVARRQQGARVRSAAAGCAWLVNTRGRVRREPGRLCNEPIWLKARGTKSWRLNLSRQLRPGQYTILSRAVEKSGVTESAFSRRDGNRVDIRLRRR